MARIRSIHPGWFTDETWVTVSPMARLLGIGLWTESDDQGAFEWKPITIKMRLFPADNADVNELLAELEAADLIRRFESNGRQLGAVRNFCKFQRPKKPNYIQALPAEFRTYVGLSDASSEPDPPTDGASSGSRVRSWPSISEQQPPSKSRSSEPRAVEVASVPQKGEPVHQMERRGGESREEPQSNSSTSSPVPGVGADALAELKRSIIQAFARANRTETPCTAWVSTWITKGYPPEFILAVVEERLARSKRPITSLAYFDDALVGAWERHRSLPPAAAVSPAAIPQDQLERNVRAFFEGEGWFLDGPDPNSTRCRAPAEMVERIRREVRGEERAA